MEAKARVAGGQAWCPRAAADQSLQDFVASFRSGVSHVSICLASRDIVRVHGKQTMAAHIHNSKGRNSRLVVCYANSFG
jgi:hypothetical protein